MTQESYIYNDASYLGGATQEVCQLSKEEVEDANSNYEWVLHEGLEMMVGVTKIGLLFIFECKRSRGRICLSFYLSQRRNVLIFINISDLQVSHICTRFYTINYRQEYRIFLYWFVRRPLPLK